MASPKKRFAAVGTGGRLRNFTDRIDDEYRESCELVALCDISQVRMDATNKRRAASFGAEPVPTYLADSFVRMLDEVKPDAVIVTTRDDTHHHYIVPTLEAGIEVITEKPMTTDALKCQEILTCAAKATAPCRVAFNYRWINWNTKVKELLLSGAIGSVKSVNMEYLLNTSHGADYYRRWHSEMACSGGLLVHKSTHHFDLVNWWVDSVPEQVFAYGDLVYYGEENAIARGDSHLTGYERYTGIEAAKDDPFSINLKDGAMLEELYYNAERETGYLRDRNVFREGIDIYDSMSVNVRYRSGTLLTYSLNSYSPREGMRVTFNGDRGRIEYYEFGGSHIIRGQSEEELAKEQAANPGEYKIVVFPHFKDRYEVQPDPARKGGHGGSDASLGEQIFAPNPPAERLGRNAGHEQGAASIIIGAAANISIAENRPVNVEDLITLKPGEAALSNLT